ncbi:MAG: hypothetical protein ABIY47_09095 [Opitutaceae bacterium]
MNLAEKFTNRVDFFADVQPLAGVLISLLLLAKLGLPLRNDSRKERA